MGHYWKVLIPALCGALGMMLYAISPASHQLFCNGPTLVI